MEKYVFLDLGGHYCEGLTQFVSKILPINHLWEIHSFEPNPLINIESIYENNKFLKSKNLNINFHKKAVWTKSGQFTFKMFGNNGCSQGSLLEETKGDKLYKDYHSNSVVECIDFWDFIKTNFTEENKIYVKMDIEWSEYAVLQDMLDRGWPQNIEAIWVEFHGKEDPVFAVTAKKLITDIKQNSCTKIIPWG